MSKLSELSKLRVMLHSLEVDLGLKSLSFNERAVFSSIIEMGGERNPVALKDLEKHELVTEISRPTLFRALKVLADGNYISQVSRGQYQVNA